MRAFVYDQYGPPSVLKLREVERPAVQAGQVLVEVRATTVTSGDTRQRALRVPRGLALLSRLALGVFRPRAKILGMEFSGVVAEIGPGVSGLAVGTPVFAATVERAGCHAEYCAVAADGPIAPMPAGLSFEDAAALAFGGTTALDFFRQGALAPGERLLVNGASGAVGTSAIQIAKHLGAHVTAVCSAANHALVRSLGADEVIDYATEDFASRGESWDVIMDTAETAPWSRSKRALSPGGRLLLVVGGLSEQLSAGWLNFRSRRRVVIAGTARLLQQDVRHLGALAASGALRPVIDRRYAFTQMVEAHAYVDAGHKRGNVVVVVRPADDVLAQVTVAA